MSDVFLVAGVVATVLVYMLPSIVSGANPYFKQRSVMFFLNLFTGWLVVPWIGMMVWALWKTKAP